MTDTDEQLPIGAKVRVLRHQHKGWRGHVRERHYGFYYLALTHDADAESLAYHHIAGPYSRGELELLTDSPQGLPSPTTPDKDVPFFFKGAPA